MTILGLVIPGYLSHWAGHAASSDPSTSAKGQCDIGASSPHLEASTSAYLQIHQFNILQLWLPRPHRIRPAHPAKSPHLPSHDNNYKISALTPPYRTWSVHSLYHSSEHAISQLLIHLNRSSIITPHKEVDKPSIRPIFIT